MHATGALAAEFYQMRLPSGAKEVLLRGFQAGARASIQQILAETGIASRKLAIETIEFPFDLTFELAEESIYRSASIPATCSPAFRAAPI